MARRPYFFIIILFIAVLSCAALAADKGANARYVNVVVTDKAGNPVPDLPATAFSVQEDGKPVTVTSVTPVKAANAELPKPQPGVAQNLAASTTGARPLTVVVLNLLDTPFDEVQRTFAIIMQFVSAALARNESVAVLTVGPDGLHPVIGLSTPARRRARPQDGLLVHQQHAIRSRHQLRRAGDALRYGSGHAGELERHDDQQ